MALWSVPPCFRAFSTFTSDSPRATKPTRGSKARPRGLIFKVGSLLERLDRHEEAEPAMARAYGDV